MADDAATVEQLRAELRQLREQYADCRAENAGLREENAAMRGEAERRDRALTEALKQQTATAEVPRILATSPTDLHRVLQAVAEGATRACGAPTALTPITTVVADAIRRVTSRPVACFLPARPGSRAGPIPMICCLSTASVARHALGGISVRAAPAHA